MDEKIVKQFTKFVFPFAYRGEGEGNITLDGFTHTSSKGTTQKIFERFDQKSNELRLGLDELLCKDGGSTKIADCYKINQSCRRLFNLPNKSNYYMSFCVRPTGETVRYAVAIDDVKVYLFESGVGFIEIDCNYQSDKIEDYFNLNYFISEIKSDRNYFTYDDSVYDAESKTRTTQTVQFTVKQLIDEVLGYVEKNVSGSGKTKVKFKETKLIIFSYLLLDKKGDNFYSLLFNARKNYKQSYMAPLEGYKITDDENAIQQFANSYWGASENGAVNISFLTPDDTTNRFFQEEFITRINTTYYSLFLHTIHQKYALMAFIGDLGSLDKLGMDYGVMQEQLEKAQKFHADAINLKFRAFFKMPSFVEHINKYFSLLQNSLKVNDLYDHFTSELENVTDICNTYVERIKARDTKIKEKRSAYKEIFVSIFSEIVALVVLFNSSWDLIEKVMGRTISFWSIQLLVVFGTLLSSIIPVVISVCSKANDIKAINAALNKEMKDKLVEDDKLRKKRKKLRKIITKN